MSYGIAVKILDSAAGIQLAGGQNFFIVQGQPVALLNDRVQGHGPGLHGAPRMAQGSPAFKINGVPACRRGHLATCGHPSTGRGWFLIDG